MRSRYTAFALGLESYLLQTWHKNTCPHALNLSNDEPIKWLGLEIKSTEKINDHSASVTFVAHYEAAGEVHSMHEVSQFILIHGLWFYESGIHTDVH